MRRACMNMRRARQQWLESEVTKNEISNQTCAGAIRSGHDIGGREF